MRNKSVFDIENEGKVSVRIQGEGAKAWPAPRTVLGYPGARMQLIGEERITNTAGEIIKLRFRDDETGLEAVNHIQFYGKSPISRRRVIVTNTSAKKLALDTLHSTLIDNIPWNGDGQYHIHIPHNFNYAENQWRENPLSAFGIIKSRKTNTVCMIVNSIGRSCQACLPMAILEDTQNNRSLIWQIEHSGSWMWDLGQGRGDVLSLGIGGLSETHNHWFKLLAPGESFESLPVSAGWVNGGADEAIAALAEYRRVACVKPHPADKNLPVIFNDYMNCLEGNPTEEKSLRLITKAAKAGCEIYVIDAGWYGEKGWSEIGNWHESRVKFPNGLKRVMDAVRSSGMVPGLWIEIEAANTDSELAHKPDSWFLTMHGRRNLWGVRHALDFRNPEVRKFADDTLDRLIGEYGLGYIKFDYNLSIQLGTDYQADSPGDGALEHTRAVQDWFCELRRRHPDVILESCASGGMRIDYGMLSILQIASSSDQNDCRFYPAITVGGMASILPEQLAAWSYPKQGEDRETAVFNMVNALLCRVHLSGQLADISTEQFDIVREGVRLYKKQIRRAIPRSLPFWPLGRITIEQTDSFNAVGLREKNGKSAWLAVWRLDTVGDTVEIPLGKYFTKNASVVQIFPEKPERRHSFKGAVLKIRFPAKYSAAIFKLTTETLRHRED